MKPKYSLKQIMSIDINTLTFPKEKNLDKEFQFIYKPNDDSYMMLYTIITDINKNENLKENTLNVCELGIGSGYILINFANFLKTQKLNCNYFGVDININSCAFSRDYGKYNNIEIEVINTNNFKSLQGLKKNIDILILNPVL
jgi:methylase of polypeptide subunit release factors